MLDLDYVEDSAAEVDLNVVMTSSGRFVEVQGTAEGPPFAREASSTTCSACRAGHRPDPPDPRRGARRLAAGSRPDGYRLRHRNDRVEAGSMRLVLATANPDKAAELAAIFSDELGDLVDLVARPEGVPAVEETGDDSGGQCPPQGRRPRRRDRRGRRRRRHRPRGRRARRGTGYARRLALPASCHLRRQRRQAAWRSSRRRDRPAGALPHRGRLSFPRRHEIVATASSRVRSPPAPRARVASATTRSSPRTVAAGAPSRRWPRLRNTTFPTGGWLCALCGPT